MLQMTEANILISSLKVTRESQEPEMPQVYARDLALTAVLCFIFGAGLALLVVLACCRAFHKKKLKERERQREEEKEGSTVVNHGVHHSGADERRRDALLQANSNITLDTRLEGCGGHVWSRSDEDSGYFRCSDCSNKGQRAMRPNLMTWNNQINTETEEDEEKEKRTVRMVVEEERRIPNHANVSSPVYETDRDMDSYRVNVDSRCKDTFHCESCHRTYRAQQSIRAGRFKSGTRDSAPPAHRWTEKGRNYNQFDAMKTTALGREARIVTFDLEGLGTLERGISEGKDKRDGEARTPRDREREKRAKIQSSQLLKVKLNLNPLRKSKVHPRKKNEEERTVERRSSKKSKKTKRPHGKDRREKGGKGKSGDKMKGSPVKVKKAARSRRCSDDGADVKEDDNKAEGKHSETVQEQSVNPDDVQSAPMDPAPDSQGGTVQYQGTGLSLSAPEQTQTTNLPLLGSAGSQLTGSGLSLQGGNLLLSSVAPRFKAVFPSGPAGSAAPSIATSGPSMGTSELTLLANSSVHVNPLQAGSVQTTPLYTPPAAGLALNLAGANSEPIFQTQLLPDSFSLPPRLTSDPIEALGLQLGEEFNKLIPESQVPQITESLAVQVQATDSLPVVSSQALNTQMEPGHVPGEGAPAEGPAADVPVPGVSGDGADGAVLLHQEYVTEEGDSSPRRKLKLALPEKTSSRPPTALERKIR